MKTLINYFLRGLLIIFPLAATGYIFIAAVRWSNSTFNDLLFEWLSVDIPGLGIATVFFAVTALGYIFSKAFTKPVLHYFEQLLVKVPLVKIVYTSIKELTEAFVGDKKRFNQPVIAQLSKDGVRRIGFVTQKDTSQFGLHDMVAVYCPHSYNFSGNLYLVPKEDITLLDLNSTEVMKFVVSGGVTEFVAEENSP